MKSTTFALVGAFAALASAYTPGKHLHFPRSNGTITSASASPSADASITTLTVKTTRTSTIISCAPTVTNCPAGKPEMNTVPESDRQTKTVTDTIALTTTVCPVAEASTISQQIIEKHNSQASATPSATAGLPAGHTVKTTQIVSTKTVYITIGQGERQSVVPTVLTTTIQSEMTVPTGSPATATPEETITTTIHSTSTKTVTITRAKPTNTAVGNEAVGNGTPATVTVTVSSPPQTVTVTAPCAAAKTDAPIENKQLQPSTGGESKHEKPAGGNKPSGVDNTGSGNAGVTVSSTPVKATSTPCDTSDFTTTIEATVTVVPYPAGNGTATAAPSGFARLRR